jgi:hypothetical protein
VNKLISLDRAQVRTFPLFVFLMMGDRVEPPTAEAAVLNNFPHAQGAEHRHGSRRGCLKGTRQAVLDEIELWAGDLDKPPVYWLNGLAGTGKSAVAQTFAERAFADGLLGASFFCSRDFEDRSNLHLIFPTIAVQLARRHTAFRSEFLQLVKSDPDIAHKSLYNQMDQLIVQPLRKSAISTVIVIDALDECIDEEPVSAILPVLMQFVSELPAVKFFITGRPDPRIRAGFHLPLLVDVTVVFALHDVQPRQVDSDIRRFFEDSFSELASRRPGLDNWPAKAQLDLLCQRAAGFFTYAVATVRFIDSRNLDPRRRLDLLLRLPGRTNYEGRTKFNSNTTLDLLYTSILRGAFGDDLPEDDAKVRSVLGTVVLAVNPLSPLTIATLPGYNTEDVTHLLSSVHSVLTLQDDINHPVQPFHKSFPDFLTDPARCTDNRFFVDPSAHHKDILFSCFSLMKDLLKNNIYNSDNYVVLGEVEDLSVRGPTCIGSSLEYACRFWTRHLASIPVHGLHVEWVQEAIDEFFANHVVCWIDALSIVGHFEVTVYAINDLQKWYTSVSYTRTDSYLACSHASPLGGRLR